MNEVAEQIADHLLELRRYALALTHNPVAADDLVQECAARALAKAQLYRANTNLRAWLFTILHNIYISGLRRDRKRLLQESSDTALAALCVPASQPAWIILATVYRSMMALPEQQRAVLYSVCIEGKSYEEVAEEFEMPLGTVKSRCFRARKTLVKRMQDVPGVDGPLSVVA